jgi:iron complex outermembrane receptor protein
MTSERRFLAQLLAGVALIASTAPVEAGSPGDAEPAAGSAAAVEAGSPGDAEPAAGAAEVAVPEILVTATKRVERAIDVPISLTTISGDTLQERGIRDINAVIQRAPNLTFTSEGGPLRSFVSIRGVQNLGGTTNAIGFYVDELNIASGFSTRQINSAFLDVEQFTVLRGPQGTAFGRNTSAGAILVTTRKPSTTEFEGDVTLGYGSRNQFFARGVVNIPLVNEKIGLRVTAYNDQNDGFLTNITNPSNTDDERTVGGRVALRITPDDRLTIDLAANYVRTRTGFIRFVPNGDPYGQLLAGFGLPYPSPTYPAGFFPDDDNKVAFNFSSGLYNRDVVLSANISYAFDGFDLVSVTGWSRNTSSERFDVDLSPADFLDRRVGTNYPSYSSELRLQSTGDSPLQWQVGGIYFHETIEDAPNDVFVGLDPDLAPILNPTFDPSVAPSPSRYLFFDSRTRDVYKGFAFFGSLEYKITPTLEARVGGRYSKTIIRSRFFNGQTDMDPTSSTYLQPIYPEPRPGGASRSFSDFSPSFSLTYTPDEDLSAYAVVSKGYKEGGLQLRAEGGGLLPDDQIFFRPETLWNYELGLKGNLFDRRLNFSLALFYLDWSNLQVNGFDPSNPLVLITRNAAKASSRGVELDFVARPATGLTLSGAVGYQDPKFDSYNDAILADGSIADVSGSRLIRSARWTANAVARYQLESSSRRPFAELEYVYQGDRYFGFEQETAQFIPSYSLVNVRVGAEFGGLSALFSVDNLFGKRYITGITGSGGFTYVGNMVAVSDDQPVLSVRLSYRF